MAKRGRKSSSENETLNPFEQYGNRHHHPSRVILFDDDSRNDVWLDALEAFDRGDKSVLVALMKSGYPIPSAILPHIGDAIDRCYDFKRPAHAPRKPTYIMTDTDVALNSADVEVGDLMRDGWTLADAIANVANKRGLPASKLSEHHARRRRSQRKR
jgi:hypothetical protein